jgi:mannose-6-phosphate isomerase
MERILVLKNPIQNYAWGSKTFIPELLGEPASKDTPQAELWVGAHPKAPSLVWHNGEWVPLPQLIQDNPEGILGKSVAKKFSNRLPFLFKVLAAERPLSIQAHPDRDRARQGFVRENSLGIPLNAPHRNYRDNNHKPEIICALTPFWALIGFRELEEIIALSDRLGASMFRDKAISLWRQSEQDALRKLFTFLMTMDRHHQRRIVADVVASCKEYADVDKAFEWTVRLNQAYADDIGVLSPLFMKIARLEPGRAMYISSGRLHAYLEGAGIELMANSDNVLRGGLTSKNIDVTELLEILDFTVDETPILTPKRGRNNENIFLSPAEEFALSMISLTQGTVFESTKKDSVEIMICTEGEAHMTDLGHAEELSLNKGTAIIIPAAAGPYRIEGHRIKGNATIYKAAVPL